MTPLWPPLSDPGSSGPPMPLEPPGRRSLAQILSQDQALRSWPSLAIQAFAPGASVLGGMGRMANTADARASLGVRPQGLAAMLANAMPWSPSVVDAIPSWDAGGHGPGIAQTGYGQEGAFSTSPTIGQLAAALASWSGEPGGGVDTGGFGNAGGYGSTNADGSINW